MAGEFQTSWLHRGLNPHFAKGSWALLPPPPLCHPPEWISLATVFFPWYKQSNVNIFPFSPFRLSSALSISDS